MSVPELTEQFESEFNQAIYNLVTDPKWETKHTARILKFALGSALESTEQERDEQKIGLRDAINFFIHYIYDDTAWDTPEEYVQQGGNNHTGE